MHQEEEDALRRDYGDGELCGTFRKNYIVQYYIHNPLLINGRKFDFRMYMLIVSTDPLMAYYHDGFLRVSLAAYDAKSHEKKVLLTNLALSQQIYNDVKGGNLYQGMDEEQLKVAQQWSFDRLQEYLLKEGIIGDPNWLDNYLRPEFKKAMVHLLRLSHYTFLEDSTLFELYGVDFMLDSNLNLWFIEANSSPALHSYSVPVEKFIVKMLRDHFEVVVGLMRSRMKRVMDYVNVTIEDSEFTVKNQVDVVVEGLEAKKGAFRRITRNSFEVEFEPKADNGFSKIYDANYYKTYRYEGLITEECI